MKRFITAMLFSLTVIVCEQQTLFAPHFTTFDGLTAANPTNSLVPVAGVDRSVPLAGTSNYCGAPKCAPSRFKLLGAATEHNPAKTNSLIAIAAPQTYGLNPGGASLMHEQGSRMHDSGEPIRDVDLPQTVNGVTVPYWNVLPPDAQDSFSHNPEW